LLGAAWHTSFKTIEAPRGHGVMAEMAKQESTRNPERERRLAEALRANLRRRKEQARAAQEASVTDKKTSE
jgi:hypothetical protein